MQKHLHDKGDRTATICVLQGSRGVTAKEKERNSHSVIVPSGGTSRERKKDREAQIILKEHERKKYPSHFSGQDDGVSGRE